MKERKVDFLVLGMVGIALLVIGIAYIVKSKLSVLVSFFVSIAYTALVVSLIFSPINGKSLMGDGLFIVILSAMVAMFNLITFIYGVKAWGKLNWKWG